MNLRAKLFETRSALIANRRKILKTQKDICEAASAYEEANAIYVKVANQAGICPVCVRRHTECKCIVMATPPKEVA